MFRCHLMNSTNPLIYMHRQTMYGSIGSLEPTNAHLLDIQHANIMIKNPHYCTRNKSINEESLPAEVKGVYHPLYELVSYKSNPHRMWPSQCFPCTNPHSNSDKQVKILNKHCAPTSRINNLLEVLPTLKVGQGSVACRWERHHLWQENNTNNSC